MMPPKKEQNTPSLNLVGEVIVGNIQHRKTDSPIMKKVEALTQSDRFMDMVAR